MGITLGTLTLETIIDWNEVKVRKIPRQTFVAASPNIDEETTVVEPLRIIITCRFTWKDRKDIYTLRDLLNWQELKDGITLIDNVWIEGINLRWEGDENYDYPWRTEISLICQGD